jgi:hypothetical protein
MTYITQLTGRKAMSILQIMTMVLAGFVLVVLQSSTVHAQWTTTGTNISNTNTGNVGVGTQTSTPSERLSVLVQDAVSNGVTQVLSIGHTTTGTPSAGLGSGLTFRAKRSDGVLASTGYIAGIWEDPTNGTEDGALVFAPLLNTSGYGTERMRITSSGNVGIGTTTPGLLLDVRGNPLVSGALRAGIGNYDLTPMAQGVGGGVQFGGKFHSNGTIAGFASISGIKENATDNDFSSALVFTTRSNPNAQTEKMRISSTGNVGIGTTTPGTFFGGTSGSGRILHVANTTAHAQLMISAAGAGNLAAVTMEVGDAAATKRAFQTRYEGANNIVKSFFFNEATGAVTQDNVLVLKNDGSIGIGTTTPVQRLQIGSNTVTSTATPDAVSLGGTYSSVAGVNPKLRLFDNNAGIVYGLGVSGGQFDFMTPAGTRYVWSVSGTEKMRLDDSGNLTVTGNIAAKYQDVAEWVQSSQELRAGTVVVLDHTRSNQVIASSQAYDTRVAGVISSQPGITLGENGAGKVLVATTGRVKVKVDASAGPIQVGDLLVTSDKEGVAKKSEPLNLGGVQIHRPGTLIGKALEPIAKGTGEILVLLSLQ